MVSVYGADDFPAPTDLMVEGNDYDAMLEWTAPDLRSLGASCSNADYSK